MALVPNARKKEFAWKILRWPMLHPFTKFYENQAINFSVILLTDKQTEIENITSLAEVMKHGH